MGRPKTKGHWEELIRVLTENEPRLGPLAIRSRLEQAAKEAEAAKVNKDELGPIPSLRTIGRLQRQFRPLSEEERQPFRLFRWPESMETGALPFEASTAALELLRGYEEAAWGRPLIGVVRWFWRVTAIAPDAPFAEREEAARYLNVLDVLPGEDTNARRVEMWLAFRPWQSDAAAEAYRVALAGAEPFPQGLTARVGDAQQLTGILASGFAGPISPWGIKSAVEFLQERFGLPDTSKHTTNEEGSQ